MNGTLKLYMKNKVVHCHSHLSNTLHNTESIKLHTFINIKRESGANETVGAVERAVATIF